MHCHSAVSTPVHGTINEPLGNGAGAAVPEALPCTSYASNVGVLEQGRGTFDWV